MANIGTIHVRCFRTPGNIRRIRTRTLSRWFCPDDTYYIPIWSRDWLRAGVVDFQYGSRHGNTMYLDEKWPDLHAFFSMIWVRRYNDAGDQDDYLVLRRDGEQYWRGPQYAFDEIELTFSGDDHFALQGGAFVTPNIWRKRIVSGRYISANGRLCWSDSMTVPTCSTETSDTYINHMPEGLPASLLDVLDNSLERVVKLDLFWQNRVVKRLIYKRGDLRQFCCDHWDNFVLPDYQQDWRKHQTVWDLSGKINTDRST